MPQYVLLLETERNVQTSRGNEESNTDFYDNELRENDI